MSRITTLGALPEGPVDRSAWTAIVPAAGRGSRLGGDEPKILFPILGRPIAAWLIEALVSICARFVFIVSPEGASAVEPILRPLCPRGALELVVQSEPTGMGDAVLLTESVLHTPHAVVIWGDQVTVSRRTLVRCAGLHERAAPSLTLPIVERPEPYIHFVRDGDDRIVAVQQRREGEIDVEVGENDCGLFFFDAVALYATLRAAKTARAGTGASTAEFNLVQLLDRFDVPPLRIASVHVDDPAETLGVNTPADARAAEAFLRARHPDHGAP